MALLRIDDPLVEPISLDETRIHLRLDTNDDDALLQSLINAARCHVERLIGRVLITQTWRQVLDAWPVTDLSVRLPIAPVREVIAVRVIDTDGTSVLLPVDNYFADVVSEPARLCRTTAAPWSSPKRPINGIEIDFIAGYGPTGEDVPQPLRQALLLLATHWYEHREPVSLEAGIGLVPQAVAGLLAPYRLRGLS